MGRRLRVFISSTMDDLPNERAAVCRKIESFNFEPVNAEGFSPDGQRSWETIKEEIASSDVVVLILGERYGWIPDSGPHASAGLSVTELEYVEARRLDIPVLPFVKRLRGPASDARAAFASRIGDWDSGLFRSEFDLAEDLAGSVGTALADLLVRQYLKREGRSRSVARPSQLARAEVAAEWLPEDLIAAVRDRSAIVLIGAGVSLAAGLPSAALFIEAMRSRIAAQDPAYRPTASGSMFFAVATDLEALLGRSELHRVVQELVNPPFLTDTTEAHRAAVELFDLVLTLNYDDLLERALPEPAARALVAGDETMVDLGKEPAIVKLHGSVERQDSLMLTEAHLATIEQRMPRVRAAVVQQLRSRPVVAVGSSLRDPSLVALLEQAGGDLNGWVVADELPLASRARLNRWRLEPVEADAGSFFAALRTAVG